MTEVFGQSRELIERLSGACPRLRDANLGEIILKQDEEMDVIHNPTREIYVDKNKTDSEIENGSFFEPFKTIQKAIDYAEVNMNPVYSNPVIIKIAAGIYNETTIIKKDGVSLHGSGGQSICRIEPTSGPALILTNATKESLTTFLANGGQADPNGNWGDLVADVFHPWDNQFRDLDFGTPAGGAGNCVMILGAGAGQSTCGNEANFMRCCIRQDIFARGVNFIAIQNDCWIAGTLTVHNIAGVWASRIQMTNYAGSYNIADEEPADTGNYGLCGAFCFLYGNINLSGSGHAGFDRLDRMQVAGNIVLSDSSQIQMEGGHVSGNLTLSGTSKFRLRNVHVQGNITNNSAVGNPCTFDGGRYMGSLTDANSNITRNLGN